jgi:hypothetical protein
MPVGTLWDLLVGGIVCNCGAEVAIIHPAEAHRQKEST